MTRMEFWLCRVLEDEDPALTHERLSPVHVEEIPKAETRDEDRVHYRVHVVGTYVRQPHGHDVRLPLDLDPLLFPYVRGTELVNGLHLAGLDGGHRGGSKDPMEDLSGDPSGGSLKCGRGGGKSRTVAQCPLPLAFLQERELRGESVGVQSGLDLKDLYAARCDETPHPPVGGVELRGGRVHERLTVGHHLGVVMMAEALVAG